ncbi:MAG: nucleotidyltransferase family protein, partial [Bacteroidota bacterium]
MLNVGLVLLAAGNSSRLGRAKQLLEWQGKTLIRHALDQSNDLAFSQRLVVYGARKLEIEPQLKQLAVPNTYNPDWSKGMSASIKKGLEVILKKQADLTAIFLCLVDQPFINRSHLQSMLEL